MRLQTPDLAGLPPAAKHELTTQADRVLGALAVAAAESTSNPDVIRRTRASVEGRARLLARHAPATLAGLTTYCGYPQHLDSLDLWPCPDYADTVAGMVDNLTDPDPLAGILDGPSLPPGLMSYVELATALDRAGVTADMDPDTAAQKLRDTLGDDTARRVLATIRDAEHQPGNPS